MRSQKISKLPLFFVFLCTLLVSPFSLSSGDVRGFYDLGSYPVLVHLSMDDLPQNKKDLKKIVPGNFFTHFFHRRDLLTAPGYHYAPFCSTVYIVSVTDHLSVSPAFDYRAMTPLMLVGRGDQPAAFGIEPFFFSKSSSVHLVFHALREPRLVLSSVPTDRSALLLLNPYRPLDTRQMWILRANNDESVSIFSAHDFRHAISLYDQHLGRNLFLSNQVLGHRQAWLFLDAKTRIDCTQYLLNLFVQPYFLDLRWDQSDRWLRLIIVDGLPFLNWSYSSEIANKFLAPQFVLSREEKVTRALYFDKKLRLSNGDCLIPAWNEEKQAFSVYSLSCVDRHASVWRYGIFDNHDPSRTQLCVHHARAVFCLGVSSDSRDRSVLWLPEKVEGRMNPQTILRWGVEFHQMPRREELVVGCVGEDVDDCLPLGSVLDEFSSMKNQSARWPDFLSLFFHNKECSSASLVSGLDFFSEDSDFDIRNENSSSCSKDSCLACVGEACRSPTCVHDFSL